MNCNVKSSRKVTGLGYTKSGFIIPISLNLQFLPSLTSQPSLAILLKKEKFTNYTGHIITNKEFDIIYLSTECLKLFQIKEKCLWSIKNYNKLKTEDRVNLKHLIVEMTEKNSWAQKKNLDFKTQLNKDIPIHLQMLNPSSVINTSRRNSKIVHDPTKLLYKTKEKEFKGLYTRTNKISGFIMAKKPVFGNKTLDSFIMKIEYPVNFQTNLDVKLNLTLMINKSFYFDFEKQNYVIETKSDVKMRSSYSPKSIKRNKERHKSKRQDKMILKDDSNIYDLENIKNYGIDVITYRYDRFTNQIN